MLLRLNTTATNALPRNLAMKATLCGYALEVVMPSYIYTPGKMLLEGAVRDGIRGTVDGMLTVHDDGTATLVET